MPIDAVAAWLIPGSALISGLLAAYISLQTRAVLAEMRKELAEAENRIILRLNGLYVRRTECQLQHTLLGVRIDASNKRDSDRE